MTDGGPLRIRLAGGPGPRDFDVFDADTGRRITNLELVEFKVDVEGVHVILAARDAVFIDLVVDPADIETVVPVAVRGLG